jgi:hypothetical protein
LDAAQAMPAQSFLARHPVAQAGEKVGSQLA